MSRPVRIAPSVLPVDFSRLGEECQTLEKAGVDLIHWDVMDGVFVPNLTFGPDVIGSIRPLVDLEFEAHLMVVEPDRIIDRYVAAGCSTVLVHAEACDHLHRTLGHIAELGATPGVALNPHTPASVIRHVRDLLGVVLVMTVNPGFGGQAYIPLEAKVAEVAAMLEDYDCSVEVDGGIGPSTVADVVSAGADRLVSGSALFRDPEGLEHAVSDLRARAEAAQA
ncbi:MAG: ribulose-phosphate 3-epimerase [Acidimicrobiales bacterium]|jgi:ribulose-phosphate 3-epimerase|nr:ribulose-phosphate 3-epimerase [Actinomycetes bacterium]MDP6160359.1 ribulose-phosphate 3-epimerase [Acidimicrobiales bacterium]MDP6288328.1 ribulose-phosphate 3-epimerase [Acidimicrobiales bacterium]MDP6910769.1 ribulose-phosphate 3-epimerase [Acidimicrobiales bacterium]HJM73836.1 ribulose-phosphate 3-epimerase [Acidimicrobiales bacterium]|tara:strand:- start:1082 stop:1750 length:669 start_codon:yes stop_codon:yes gene_type:complete